MLIELSTGEKCSSEALWQMQHNKAAQSTVYSVQFVQYILEVYCQQLQFQAIIIIIINHKVQHMHHFPHSFLYYFHTHYSCSLALLARRKWKVDSEWDDLATVNCNKTEPQADPFVWQLEDVR